MGFSWKGLGKDLVSVGKVHPIGAYYNAASKIGKVTPPKTPGAHGATNPQVTAMQRKLNAMPGPQKLGMEALPESRATQPLPEFEIARRKAEQRSRADEQQAVDALQRRFAAMGSLNSGAAIKQQQLTMEQGAQSRQEAAQALDAEEMAARRQIESEDFARQDSVKQRNFQREVANADSDFKDRVFRFDAGSKISQLDLAFQQMELARSESGFNRGLAEQQLKKSGGLLGGGGFLGTGIGA